MQTSANGVTRTMVYDIFGQDVADYSSGMLERENIYRGGQLLATQEFNNRVNVALADNGGTAVASSTYGTNVAANVNNGDRKGTNGVVWKPQTGVWLAILAILPMCICRSLTRRLIDSQPVVLRKVMRRLSSRIARSQP